MKTRDQTGDPNFVLFMMVNSNRGTAPTNDFFGALLIASFFGFLFLKSQYNEMKDM